MVSNGYSRAISSLWTGRCTVTVRSSAGVVDERTGRVVQNEMDIFTNEPCRISFERVTNAEPSDGAAKVTQGAMLFIDPAVSIPPGSKLTVTQNGLTGIYEQSGEPAVYRFHQEVPLALSERWA